MGATLESTQSFAEQFSHYRDFYVEFDGLVFSKLGLGTFKPEPYKEENYLFDYKNATKSAIRNGINVLDSASNYRYGQSEKEIGEAVSELIANNEIKRENLIITSKGGFIQLDFPFPQNPYQWINETIIKSNLATEDDIELDQHCMTPDFLEYSLNRSLQNLQVENIDIYFLHNPEMQVIRLSEDKFYEAITNAFVKFEEMVKIGKIKKYGVATWNGLLLDESNAEFVSLEKIYDCALKAGGENHNFKYIQVPFNLAKTTALTVANQKIDSEYYTLLNGAKKFGLGVMGSSSLLQMNLFKRQFKPELSYLLDPQTKLTTNIQLALQYVRSTRGFVTNLFGSSDELHIKHNVAISEIKAVSQKNYDLIFRI